ncbi:MAG: autotransporter domain-containing protein [Vulcanococcus sp.]
MSAAIASTRAMPAKGQNITVDYGGQRYTLSSDTALSYKGSSLFIPGVLRKTSWYGNQSLAQALAGAAGLQLGISDTRQSGSIYEQYGAMFATFVGTDKDPFYNPNYGYRVDYCYYKKFNDGSTARADCYQQGNFSVGYLYATEPVDPQPIPQSVAILPSGNVIGGSGGNLTSNLGSSLLPQFQGGTLTVATPNAVVSDDFMLGTAVGNAIDAAGNDAAFNGSFSADAASAGDQVKIEFKNSVTARPATITLGKASDYAGVTTIFGSTTLAQASANLLSPSSYYTLKDNAILDLGGQSATIRALNSGAGSQAQVRLGTGTLTLGGNNPALGTVASFFAGSIVGYGGLVKGGSYEQRLAGLNTYVGDTQVQAGKLTVGVGGKGSITSNVMVDRGATLGGSGIIQGTVNNFGTVSPGNSIGTLTIKDGNYVQWDGAVLALEVDGSTSDLLRITGSGTVTDLAGTVKISGNPTPGLLYTGIEGPTAYSGTSTANADTSSVVIASAYKFCREDDACFRYLNGSPSVDKTKLQFGWASLDTTGAVVPVKDTTPQQAISFAKNKGGPLTKVITGSVEPAPPTPDPGPTPGPGPSPRPSNPSLIDTCISNTQDPQGCNTALQPGKAMPPVSPNLITVAKGFDGGNAAVAVAVNSGQTGGAPIPTATGGTTGYTTNQAKAAGLPADLVTVLSAVNSLPTRSAVISSLHQVTAEPYASMQSVALEAMEQFRFNTLALSRGDKAIRLFTDAEVCRLDDGTLIPASSEQRPTDCKPRKISQASRWSLLIDATNSQASLDGTNDLASLDYNVFQSIYGLQYDASRQWSIGGAFGYGQANLYNYEYANSTINSNTYSGGLWGIYRPGDAWKITGMVGYMNLQYDSSRQISFGGINRNAWANWSGNGFTTALDVQYDWVLSGNKADRNAVRLKPNTYLSYSLHNQGDITERGADSLNLAINGHTADSLIYGIGFTLETPVQLARSTRLIPRLSVGYEYDFNGDANEEHQLTASFADVPALGSLDVLGQNRGANDLNVGLSVELETSDQLSLYAGVGGSFWSNGNEINYGGGLRWRFGGAPKATVAKALPPSAPAEPEPQAVPVPAAPAPSIRGLW